LRGSIGLLADPLDRQGYNWKETGESLGSYLWELGLRGGHGFGGRLISREMGPEDLVENRIEKQSGVPGLSV